MNKIPNRFYRYTGNDPLNRIDPSGLSDMRYPWNGAVVNLSKQPVYILTQNRYERLSPFSATPDASGRSKDVDGVWIWYTNSGWKFFPVMSVGVSFKPQRLIIQPDLSVYRDHGSLEGVKPCPPWDGEGTEKGSPYERGAVDARGERTNNPPDPRQNYQRGEDWFPVLPGDREWYRNGQEW